MNIMQALFNSLNQRKRPEDIADLIAQELKGQLSRSESQVLQRAAKGSLRQRVFGYTSMLQEFAKPVGAGRQVATAIDLFESAYPLSIEACDQPEAVEHFIRHLILGRRLASRLAKATLLGIVWIARRERQPGWTYHGDVIISCSVNWIALLYAMGMEGLLEMLCFGKVLRLMAADVVAWHYQSGGQLERDTFVWNDLPLPWEVFSGKESCPLSMVEQACRKQGIDPIKSGWTGPRPRTKVAKFNPTPELVHGLSVGSPFLATYLRDLGFYSGKKVKQSLPQPIASQLHRRVLRQHITGLTSQTD